jgi:nucleotide-binding universal stress UspA family protein
LKAVLAAIDGSPISRLVAQTAFRFSKNLRLPLVIIYVSAGHLLSGAPQPSTSPVEPGPTPLIPLKDKAVHEDTRGVLQIVEELLSHGARVKLLTLSGDPASVIVEQAEKLAALLVIGYRGGGMIEPGTGRVLKKVLEKSSVPVVVVTKNVDEAVLSSLGADKDGDYG